ncbi:MAG: RNA pseudouridine synthase [Blastopirellula sp.]|nr:MAG: RNA pseudouridine synthase [Blastopirellula sp.]
MESDQSDDLSLGSGPFEITISDEFAGIRLDHFVVSQLLGTVSRGNVQKMIKANLVSINGNPAKSSHKLQLDELVLITLPEVEEKVEKDLPPPILLEVLFEDEHMAAVYKLPGMVTHPAKGFWSGTVTESIAAQLDQLSDIGGPTRPGIVHRLDRDTSGVILVAKTNAAHEQIVKQFKDRTVEKEYTAIVSGVSDRDRDLIDLPIGKHPKNREQMSVRRNDPDAKSAQTFFEVTERFQGYSLLKVLPKTGRTHQIRLHLIHAHHPILCDRQYAGHATITAGELTHTDDDTVVLTRMALHARRIGLVHPITQEPLEIEAPVPEDMSRVLDILRG